MKNLPETILQFGAGNFLRAFADLFVHQANRQGQNIGRIVVVQSTGDARANLLNQQGGRYHVVVRGLEDGRVVDRVEEVASISRALFAASQWADILEASHARGNVLFLYHGSHDQNVGLFVERIRYFFSSEAEHPRKLCRVRFNLQGATPQTGVDWVAHRLDRA